MPAQTVNSTKLATMDANLEPGLVANSESIQPSLDDIANVVNTNANVFNTHETSTTLAHPDGSVTTAKLANNAVTTVKITDQNVTTAKVADLGITTVKLADAAVTSAKIADGTIVNADVSPAASIDGSKLANQTITSAQIADGTIADVDLTDSGVTSGTYKSVTVNSKGRITDGTNPTTLSGYGITDAAPLSHVGAGGSSQHPDATTSQSGFISAADLIAFRSLTPTGLGSYAVPVGQIFSLWSRYSQEQDPVTGELVFYEI